MSDAIVSWFSNMNEYTAVFFMSMLPIVELRGSIIFAAATDLPYVWAYIISVIGNMIPIPFVILFLRPIFKLAQNHKAFFSGAANWVQERSMKKRRAKLSSTKCSGFFIFVAIPLPGTGAWTGAIIASILNMRISRALPPIFFGVLTAGFYNACRILRTF
ncbi:MAG: small multi-drug export protein [Clostridiales bacterium]|nr:MAG: small multi-drug export protein [Clostridiales bacterium]